MNLMYIPGVFAKCAKIINYKLIFVVDLNQGLGAKLPTFDLVI